MGLIEGPVESPQMGLGVGQAGLDQFDGGGRVEAVVVSEPGLSRVRLAGQTDDRVEPPAERADLSDHRGQVGGHHVGGVAEAVAGVFEGLFGRSEEFENTFHLHSLVLIRCIIINTNHEDAPGTLTSRYSIPLSVDLHTAYGSEVRRWWSAFRIGF